MALNPNNLENLTPPETSEGAPEDISPAVGQHRLLIKALEEALRELKDDLKAVKDDQKSHFKWFIAGFCGGFVILAGAAIQAHYRLSDKIDMANEKQAEIKNVVTKIDTRLEDLMQRIQVQKPNK